MKNEEKKIWLVDILKLAGFDDSSPTKLVRHQDRRYPVTKLRENDWLELYQKYQSKARFHGVQQVLTFYGLPGTRAGFYGLYKVRGYRPAKSGEVLESCPLSKQWNQDATYYYDLERDQTFDAFRDRIIIEWGPATLSWVQKLRPKAVLEILEPGRRLPPFVDYLEFSLSYSDLKRLFANERAHADWKSSLSAVAGIYLILAEGSGNQYVGSAYGAEGIWGRWRNYATTGHGGNDKLKNLVETDANYPGSFRFSILQILPKSMAPNEVIRREMRYMYKLGSRAIGLNS